MHVAVDRSAFKDYVPFKSYVLAMADQRQIPVKGIGTVELKIRRQPGSKENHKILLENVLHVPGWMCNILSDVYFLPAKDYEHDWCDFGVDFQKFEDNKWQAWGFTEDFCGLDKLVLSRKQDGRSPMLEDREREVFSINVMWPQSQRDKWDRLVAMEIKMDAEEQEAVARAEAARKVEKKSHMGKVVQLKKSLPDISQLELELRSGLSEADPNLQRAASAKGCSLKPTASKSAFREAFLRRKSTDQ